VVLQVIPNFIDVLLLPYPLLNLFAKMIHAQEDPLTSGTRSMLTAF